MIQVINPRTGKVSDAEIIEHAKRYCLVTLKWNSRTIRCDYDNIRWVSPDWYKKDTEEK